MNIFLLGVPPVGGGGNNELYHTALLWRKMGLDVTLLAIKRCRCSYQTPFPVGNPLTKLAEEAGCHFAEYEYGHAKDVPHLADSILVDFCHRCTGHLWPELEGIGVRLIHSPCMTYVRPCDSTTLSQLPPTAVHYQSGFQEEILRPAYSTWGVPEDMHFRIPGAFDETLFPFTPLPHKHNEPFYVCKIGRGVRTKWPATLWSILRAARGYGADVRMFCLGWSVDVEEKCGPPPEWARCFPQETVDVHHLLKRCHAMLCLNGGDIENWPRVGLEAMATGVPVIAERNGGWPELMGPGLAHLLDNDPGHFHRCIAFLLQNEHERQKIIVRQHARMLDITDPTVIANLWSLAFLAVERRGR